MLRENEVVMLVLGIGVLFLILFNMQHVKKIRSWKILVTSYYLLLFGWIFTVLEEFVLETVLNLFEHVCYLSSSVLMILWCIKATSREKSEETI